MTRENKLALVIGFGLLLLAGILVSDHLSAQQRLEEDPLRALEPGWVEVPDILKPAPNQQATEALTRSPVDVPQTRTPNTSIRPAVPQELAQGERRAQVSSNVMPRQATRSQTPTSTVQRHVVQRGDSLSSISKLYYGSSGHTDLLARTNGLANPNNVPLGTSLVIPDRGRTATPATTPRSSTRTVARQTTVRDGETLSEIAQRELGSSKAWPKIWKANKNILPDPDKLKAGMTLTIPVVTASR